MTLFLDTPVDKSLGVTGAWTDIDLSSDVPASATGAIFRVVNTGAVASYGLRKNGSTDDRYQDIDVNSQQFAIIGLDTNRKCEGKIESTGIDFFLIGYTEGDVTFFTNATDKSLSATGAWTDIDLSSNIAAGSVAAIFEVINTYALGGKSYGLRRNGSTDDRYPDIGRNNRNFIIVGVDANRKCEGYIGSVDVDFYLLGYLTMGQAEINAHDRSLGATGSYVDIDESGSAPSGATGVFGELVSTSAYKFAARKKGTTFDYYEDCPKHDAIMAGLDANRKWEGKIEWTTVDFYSMGYFVAGITAKISSDAGVGADTATVVLCSRSEADVGTGEEEAVGIGINESDIGVGVDDLLVLLLSAADVGMGIDSASELRGFINDTEIGIGIEASNLLAELEQSDFGAAVDNLADLLAEIQESDSGSGIEATLVWVYLILKLLQKKELNLKLLQKKELNLKLSQPRK
jgi:hypothetical protein